MIERVVGPINGYYIASYACEMGEFGREFLGFAKLCTSRPLSYWDAQGVARFDGEALVQNAEDALASAEQSAQRQIWRLDSKGWRA